MRQQHSHTRNNDGVQSWLGMVLQYCMAALLCFAFIFGQTSTLANQAEAEVCQLQCDAPQLSNNDDRLAGCNQPIDLPVAPYQNPEEPQAPDEGESTDSVDDELSKVLSVSRKLQLALHSENTLLTQLLLSIESRSKVSLIILHHSWKCFLL